ncbi:MAG: aspartate--tRNA ligase [Actinomycetota bacterium]|nr:aspartate--tRNA ligase [Acidimicrobiales bacterium]MED5552937.1 aspartate--tRNA ligase [Actinomycetota bacterium]MEE2680369.1 aspartate--tRNA ligase [Actinomycetota bacterium]MEE3187456.1 aspartate--tRNA ligase [Actinomycetota bacterium]
MRTDYCGRLSVDDIGRTVTVCGWVSKRREHGEFLAFVDLRDRTGIIQCVVDHAHDIRSEYVLAVTGTIRERPPETINHELPTGAIEIGEATVEILSEAEPTPFQLSGRVEVDETIRIRHRYLDLRTDRMQRNLRSRALINAAIRRAMDAQEFVEVETPMLIASTPEGARDFVVPSRLNPGNFYALPQSPQLFKQLCMVGGIDRYYQIARCMRDEDLRADRQFEFTQLDMEMSFVDGQEVRAVVSQAVAEAAELITGHKPSAIPEMSWLEAMNRYGSDKPDIRFDLELVDLTEIFSETDFNAFKAPCIKGIRVEGGGETGRNKLDQLTDKAKTWGAKGLVWIKVGESGEVSSPVAKFMSDAEIAGLIDKLGAGNGDICYLVADEWRRAVHVLGLLRLELGRPPVNEGGFHFLWVIDFPLFEDIDDAGNPVPAHHPFTMPHLEDLELLAASGEDPSVLLDVRSQAYDLVLNGWELGSGSVRIHSRDIQQQIFDLLGIGEEESQRKFGFLMDAFRYGAPPHAGFAFGIDRLVALLVGEENIREVIAFPKSQSGTDPLTEAPTPIDSAQLDELGLRLLPPAN